MYYETMLPVPKHTRPSHIGLECATDSGCVIAFMVHRSFTSQDEEHFVVGQREEALLPNISHRVVIAAPCSASMIRLELSHPV